LLLYKTDFDPLVCSFRNGWLDMRDPFKLRTQGTVPRATLIRVGPGH